MAGLEETSFWRRGPDVLRNCEKFAQTFGIPDFSAKLRHVESFLESFSSNELANQKRDWSKVYSYRMSKVEKMKIQKIFENERKPSDQVPEVAGSTEKCAESFLCAKFSFSRTFENLLKLLKQ